MTELPAFEIRKRQPRPPHVAKVVASGDIVNEYGTRILVRVYESRKGDEWWISASLDGMRMSNTLHTKVNSKGIGWIADVNKERVTIKERVLPGHVAAVLAQVEDLKVGDRVAVLTEALAQAKRLLRKGAGR